MYLNKHPTSSDLEYIESWLQQEYTTYGEGFYSNWDSILKCFHEKRLVIFGVNNNAVGFITWYDGTVQRNIQIMAVNPQFRNKGFGRKFYKEFEELSRRQGFLTIILFCSPEDSQFFWRKIGFIDIHKASSVYLHLSLYKPLVNRLQTTYGTPLNKLELWDEEPYKVKTETPPKWTWDLSELSSSNPILEACSYEWNLRLTFQGKTIDENKVKYFTKGRVHFDSFLYVTYENIWK